MSQLNWKGRPYRPIGGTGFIKVYKPDINELLKPLSQKKGLGSAILTGNAINPNNQPTSQPVVTPSPTPSVTVTSTPTVTPTNTPSVTPTEPYDIYLFEECGNPSNQFRFENVVGLLNVGEVYYISGGSSSLIWSSTTSTWSGETTTWDSTSSVFNGYASVISYSAVGPTYSGTGITFTLQPNCPGVTPTPSVTQTNTPTNTNTPSITPSPTPFDSDATTFLNAVVATGGTLNATISAATNTLFSSLKSNGLYTSMKAMYPFIGSTSGSCAINAVSPGTYNISWFGGMSFGVSGATGNGTNGWGNTNLIQTAFTQNSVSAGVYQITSLSGGAEFVFGNFSTGGLPAIQLSTYLTTLGGNYAYRLGSTSITSQTYSGNTGMFVISRTTGSTTTHNLYRNGSLINSTSNSYTATTTPNAIYVFARQGSGGATQEFSPQTLAFIFFADGLSGSQVSTLSSIINTFNTSLSRNVY
jgi:hypothetical protein